MPSQSLSAPSQVSGIGNTPEPHGSQIANSLQLITPSEHAPTLRREGGPTKQSRTVPGMHVQPSSTTPLQLSSRPLPAPSPQRSIGTHSPEQPEPEPSPKLARFASVPGGT